MNDNRPEPIFPKGISFYKRNPNAPAFIKGKLRLNINDLMPFLKEMRSLGNIDARGNIDFDLKESRKEENPLYFQYNDYKSPETKSVEEIKQQIGEKISYRTGELSEGERSSLDAHRSSHNRANEEWNISAEEIGF